MRQHAHEQAEVLLQSSNPLARIQEDLAALGFQHDLGPATLAYLVAVSRLLREPLWATLTGDSGSGKSKLKDTIGRMVPRRDRLETAETTDQALMYRAVDGPLKLGGMILIGDERASNAADPRWLRTLYEAGRATKLSVVGGKSVEMVIEGCPAALDTTTASSFFAEDQNRRLILPLSESPQKYNSVMAGIARDYAVGRADADALVARHEAVQSLLPRQLQIRIPFAQHIPVYGFSAGGGRITRAFKQLLILIETIVIVRHRQRQPIDNFVVATIDDYVAAHGLHEPICRAALGDLSDQAVDLATLIDTGLGQLAVTDAARRGFSRKHIATWSGLTKSTLERRINELADQGILNLVRAGGRGCEHRYSLAENWRDCCKGGTGFNSPDRVQHLMGDGHGNPLAGTTGETPNECPGNAQSELGIAEAVH